LPAQGEHQDRFATAAKLQAKYQDDHRIVAVKGISEFEVFGFEGTLHREFSGILGIYRTHTTGRLGISGFYLFSDMRAGG
jgi:hypothetical protein